jgi:hypothetical protein
MKGASRDATRINDQEAPMLGNADGIERHPKTGEE